MAFPLWNVCFVVLLGLGALAQGVYALWPRRPTFAVALTGAAAVAAAALYDRDIVLLMGQMLALPLLRTLRGGAAR